MKNFVYATDIELADIQQTESFLQEKIDYYKMNFPGSPEIREMEIALNVLWDLEDDLDSDEDDEDDEDEDEEEGGDAIPYEYTIDWTDGGYTYGLVCARNREEATELVYNAYADDKESIETLGICLAEDISIFSTMEIGTVEECGWGTL